MLENSFKIFSKGERSMVKVTQCIMDAKKGTKKGKKVRMKKKRERKLKKC